MTGRPKTSLLEVCKINREINRPVSRLIEEWSWLCIEVICFLLEEDLLFCSVSDFLALMRARVVIGFVGVIP